jgi:hypothetical protein
MGQYRWIPLDTGGYRWIPPKTGGVYPSIGRLRTSNSRVKATHLAKSVQKPKPKDAFFASCRNLRFSRKGQVGPRLVCRKMHLRAPTSTYRHLAFFSQITNNKFAMTNSQW